LETDFFRNPITIDDVLIEVAGKIFGGLKERSALLVGSNEEMPHLADALRQGGIRHLYFTPTARALESSAKTFEWEIWTMSSQEEAPAWPQQMSMLPFIDLLLLLDQSANRQGMRSLLQQLMAMRHNAPLLFADLTTPSSPGDHEKTKPGQSGSTEAGAIAGDTIEKMYNLFFFRRRDLQQMVEQNLRARQQVDGEVSAWISQEVRQFYQWASSEDRFHFGSMVGRSRQMQRVFELIARIAQNDITVLIEGESGTGKELVAQAIHQSSHRARKPFVVVNCGALPESLLESELFGHIRGAFTGAIKNKRGLFEEANDGTIFLDEIGEMSPALQMKLLRFLQDGEIKRVGSNTVLKLEVRVLTATNRNLQQMVNEGKFRSDLYYRLNVIQITLPPLRERMEDLPILASHFLRKYAGRLRKPLAGISPEAMQKLSEYNWPGNVRELENVMERAVALASDIKLGIADFPDVIRKASGAALQHSPSEVIAGSTIGANRALRPTLEEVERQYILETVTACEGNYDEAAKQLGIGRTTLWRKLKMYQNENGKPPL
jgi:transcriptional regulator with PAS, ATPase and Fis domain